MTSGRDGLICGLHEEPAAVSAKTAMGNASRIITKHSEVYHEIQDNIDDIGRAGFDSDLNLKRQEVLRELKHTKKQIESNKGALIDERGSEEVGALLRLLSAFIDVQQGYFDLVDMIREGGSVRETRQSADDINMDARLDEQKRALDKYNRVT